MARLYNPNNRRARHRRIEEDVRAREDIRAGIKLGIAGGVYLDPKEFTDLFRKNANNRNRSIIAERIHLLAQNYIRRYSHQPWLNLEDAAAEATRIAIGKIWHYTKKCQHANAFNYFTKIIQNEVRRQLVMDDNRAKGFPPHSRRVKFPAADGQAMADVCALNRAGVM